MPDEPILTDQQIKYLNNLEFLIRYDLSCNTSSNGIPCSACRTSAVDRMKKYLKIHGYTVTRKEAVPCKPQKR